jgi:trehalose 6-phosphate synthase/phosphatase
VPPDLAYVRNLNLRHELNQLLANTEMDIFTGNKIIEIKPHLIRKGRIVNEILRKNPSDFVMAIGDDYTDEDMFAALPESVHTIKVGLGETNARSQISSVEKVHNLLQAFVESTSEE